MSGVTAATLIGAAVTAGVGIYSATQQSKSAREALDASKEQNAKLEANKPQQAKAPSTNPVADSIGTGTNALGTGDFTSNTLLTGAQGVQDALSLSKKGIGTLGGGNTLLGG